MNADTRLWADFELLTEAASTMAHDTDRLFLALLLLCGTMALAIAVTLVTFCVRYRAGSPAPRGPAVRRSVRLEVAWVTLPTLVFLGLFAWGARVFVQRYPSSPDALPVYVVAKQWMWLLQHREGRREINELHVPVGEPVTLVMTSQDAIHSFFVPAFRLKQDVVPGRYTRMAFTATRVGEYPLYCSEYCGSEHSQMIGRIVVMNAGDYGRWLAAGPATPSLAQYGFAMYQRLQCGSCHEAGGVARAPDLDDVAGRTVRLAGGRTTIADDDYLRDAILDPAKDVVAGFDAIMPPYAGRLDEADLQSLVHYLHARRRRDEGRAPTPARAVR